MILIKRIDRFVLSKFLLVFAASFFVCLFVFMMQFTWRYVDELIGKGLTLDILVKFFWYMGITLVPTSLPLSILLASLIAFGNMGEQLELLAMKSAGIPLIRIMAPLICVAMMLGGTSFYFQNKTSPEAQLKLTTLLLSMKQTSPALEIPEGVFYNGVPDVNLYVQKKNVATGMLYQIILYKTDQGFERAQIVLADSGRMEMTADKQHLVLDLWQGEQFQILQAQNMVGALRNSDVPYDRETFKQKTILIDFDANFNLLDANMLRDMAQAKNMREIELSVDTMSYELDSMGRVNYNDAVSRVYRLDGEKTAAARAEMKKTDPYYSYGDYHTQKVDVSKIPAQSFDKIWEQVPNNEKLAYTQAAASQVSGYKIDLDWRKQVSAQTSSFIRKHWVEWHQKMTLSLACIIFFFIGAPLGAIIRKGGLGMPAVISVIIFVFYFIINTSGMKMARDGNWNMVYGMWISTVVLAPIGVFLTYKANGDSVVFNIDVYMQTIRRFLGWRTKRNIPRKEVIIDNPDYPAVYERIELLKSACHDYNNRHKLYLAPNYFKIFFRHSIDREVEQIGERLENIVTELSNTRSGNILHLINQYPQIYVHAHTTPFDLHRWNILAGIVFPFGLILWARIWRFRLRLFRDMKVIEKTSDDLLVQIRQEIDSERLNNKARPSENMTDVPDDMTDVPETVKDVQENAGDVQDLSEDV